MNNREDFVMAVEADEVSPTRRLGRWAKRHKTALLFGAAGASAAVTFGLHPSETWKEIEQQVPWAVPGILATDLVNASGVAMMGVAVGRSVKWREITHLKSQLPNIAEQADGSKTFNAGFWTSTTGGVGAFAVGAAAVLPNFPVESWGILLPLAADLGQTITTRVAIKQVISAAAIRNTATALPKV